MKQMLKNKNQKSEASTQYGGVAMMMAVALASLGLVLTTNVTNLQNKARNNLKVAIDHQSLEIANRSALDIASQLISTGAFQLAADNQKVAQVLEIPTIQRETTDVLEALDIDDQNQVSHVNYVIEANQSNFVTGQSGNNWWVDGTDLYIKSCSYLKPNPSINDQIFNAANIDSQPNAYVFQGSCSAEQTITTKINNFKKYLFTDAKGRIPPGAYSHYHVSSVTYNNSGQSITKQAYLRMPEITQKCNAIIRDSTAGYTIPTSEDLKECNVDHCRFMEPVRVNGVPQYNDAGELLLRPNMSYKEKVTITSEALNLAKYTSETEVGDPKPTDLIRFYDDPNFPYQNEPIGEGRSQAALWPGLKNPFVETQYVGAGENQEELLMQNEDGAYEFILDIARVRGSEGEEFPLVDLDNGYSLITAVGNVTFEGYLVKSNDVASNGSALASWPDHIGIQDEDFKEKLDGGCRRTMFGDDTPDDQLPDACAKIKLPVAQLEYLYTKKRNCTYSGPVLDANFPVNDTRFWDPASMYPWTQDAERTHDIADAGSVTSATDRGAVFWGYVDPTQETRARLFEDSEMDKHHVLNKDTYALEKRSFVPRGANNQPLKIFESRWLDLYRYTRTGFNGVAYTYKRDKITQTWYTNCVKKDLDEDEINAYFRFTEQQTLCFYVTYRNLEDRFACTRNIEKICRNEDGCFAEDTEILMADGSRKKIGAISKGEFVYNPRTKKQAQVKIVTVGGQKKPMYEISVVGSDKPYTITFNHPVTTQRGIVMAESVTVLDKLLMENGILVNIASIKKLPVDNSRKVWNLLLADENGEVTRNHEDHFLVANGHISGDWYIQNHGMDAEDEYTKFSQFLKNQKIGD